MDQPGTTGQYGLRLWHFGVVLILQLVAFAAWCGKIEQQVADISERQTRMDNLAGVSREEFRVFQQDVLQRLDRLQQVILDLDAKR